ncbi:MAG: type 4a pilus biogenesis protein PilO [Magnetococcales bacterium]|nr:type 4a pilus biogenesis protein PilO [Magnetococcales bacterium]
MDLGFDPLVLLRLKLVEKIAAALGILAFIAFFYWFQWYGDRADQIAALEKTVKELVDKEESQRRMLTQLPQLREELAALKIKERKAMEELPSSKELPSLLTDISEAGHTQGLDFQLFAPLQEFPQQFYAEVPINLQFQGAYHNVAQFLDRVSHLHRIVTVGDLRLAAVHEANQLGPDGRPLPFKAALNASAKAVTYRFLDPDEGKKDGAPGEVKK